MADAAPARAGRARARARAGLGSRVDDQPRFRGLFPHPARFADGAEKAVKIEWLGQVIVSSRLKRTHGGFHIVQPGQHDHRHIRLFFTKLREHLDAVPVRQAMVQHHRHDGGVQKLETLAPRLSRHWMPTPAFRRNDQ